MYLRHSGSRILCSRSFHSIRIDRICCSHSDRRRNPLKMAKVTQKRAHRKIERLHTVSPAHGQYANYLGCIWCPAMVMTMTLLLWLLLPWSTFALVVAAAVDFHYCSGFGFHSDSNFDSHFANYCRLHCIWRHNPDYRYQLDVRRFLFPRRMRCRVRIQTRTWSVCSIRHCQRIDKISCNPAGQRKIPPPCTRNSTTSLSKQAKKDECACRHAIKNNNKIIRNNKKLRAGTFGVDWIVAIEKAGNLFGNNQKLNCGFMRLMLVSLHSEYC